MTRFIKTIFFFGLVIIFSSITLESTSYAEETKLLSVIDQSLSWNTFIGSAHIDAGRGVAVDGTGNVYVTGGLQGTWGTPINPYAGGSDVFIAKFDTNGTLQWNTFIGSTLSEEAKAIYVDSSGNIYVSGFGYATWGSPVAPHSGVQDAFAAKLDNTGALLWHTFMGSDLQDFSYGLTVDGSGNVYVGGQSNKTWGTPIVPHGGANDVFAVKLNSSGVLQWHTFMGGSGSDTHRGIDVDGMGDIYVSGGSGSTWSTPINAHAGSNDVFVAKLDSSGILQWNTFMGGSDSDNCTNLCVDTSNNIYISGVSESTWGSPINAHAGFYDSLVAKLNSSGIRQWHTFQGSYSDDAGNAIAVSDNGIIYVAGFSNVSWGTPANPLTGSYDVFVAGLSNNGVLHWNTFMGSTNYEFPYAIDEDGGGNIYIVGDSPETWGAPIHAHIGEVDTFVAKLSVPQVPEANVRLAGVNFADGSTRNLGTRPSSLVMGRNFTFTIENNGAVPLNLTGMPEVTIGGSHGSHFQVSQQPTTPVPPYGSTTFKIRTVRDSLPGFLPIGWEYSVSFTVNIPNDDAGANPYDFTINFTLKKD